MVDLIHNIAPIVQLFIPGWVLLMCIKAITGREISNDTERWVIAIISSCMIIAIDAFVLRLCGKSMQFDWSDLFVVCVLAALIGVVVGCLYRCDKLNTWFSKRFIRTMRNSIWEDKINYNRNTSMVITLNNGHTVIGTLDYIEERGNDSWMLLIGYSYDCGETEYDSDKYTEQKIDASIAIKLSDIEAVQICYFPDQPEE